MTMNLLFGLISWLIISQREPLQDIRYIAVTWIQDFLTIKPAPIKPKIEPLRSKKTEKRVVKKTNSKPIILEDWKANIAKKICDPKYEWDCKIALAVAYAESGLNPDAKSPTNDHGIFQLNGKKIYDIDENIEEAYRMYQNRNWQPWSAYNNGAYKKYNITSSGSIIE